MNFKKRANGSWHDIPHYIHNTATDTITTLPAVVYPNDTTATVGLKGNMEQASGASPTNPIQPSECGDRTGNLFDKDAPYEKGYLAADGSFVSSNGARLSDFIRISGEQITISATLQISGDAMRLGFYDQNKNFIERKTVTSSSYTYSNSSAYYVRVGCFILNYDYDSFMVNSGSTALPYEPYGYKIPISMGGTTNNVYLGEVQTVRQIKKLVLTGEESWNKNSADASDTLYWIRVSSTAQSRCVISHLQYSAAIPTGTTIGFAIRSTNNVLYFNFGADVMNAQPSRNTVAGLKEYLAAQYAAGTPVTIWYVLATPETAVVNEPLRKIGDYADEVSGITIPTIAGANTLSVDTTLQPSEVSVNYHGWHPVQSVHERDNGAWD